MVPWRVVIETVTLVLAPWHKEYNCAYAQDKEAYLGYCARMLAEKTLSLVIHGYVVGLNCPNVQKNNKSSPRLAISSSLKLSLS